jgi:hypothetical protein
MRKSTAAAIVARRLRVPEGRASALVQRASEAGLLPTATGSTVPDLGPHEMTNVFLAVVADRGLGTVGRTVSEFADLATETGETFGDTLTALFSHGPALASAATGTLIVRLDPASVSLTAGGIYDRYGPEPPPGAAGKHVIVPGQTLAAIGLEFAGHSAEDADALVALARVSASASVGHAMNPVPR